MNSKHFSAQERVSLVDFYSARIINTYENERIS
jgi:hypothetical protein